MTHLDDLVQRLVSDTPSSPEGAQPPVGAAIALRHSDGGASAAAGDRTPSGEPMTVTTHHDMASVTKVMATTTALLRLVSSAAVGLEDRIRRYVPEFSGPSKDDVTLRHLLQHRGGLREWLPTYLYAPEGDREAALRVAAELPLAQAVDAGRHYSDLGFMLLGRVVEVATGLGLREAVTELVTQPLSLNATRYGEPFSDEVSTSALDDRVEMGMIEADPGYRAHPFDRWRRDPIQAVVNDGNAHFAFDGVAGHAGLFSTLDDMLALASSMAAAEEHEDLWRRDVVEEFLGPGPDAGQALGWRRYEMMLDGEHLSLFGHPGFVGCAIGFVPGRRIALAMCTNRLLRGAAPVPTESLFAQCIGAAAATITETSR